MFSKVEMFGKVHSSIRALQNATDLDCCWSQQRMIEILAWKTCAFLPAHLTEMQSSIMFDNLIFDDSLDIVISRIRISESFDDLRSQKQMRVLKLMHDNLIACKT